MKIKIKYKNGLVEIKEASSFNIRTKNPCINCRSDGGCYDHGCFLPEDWGDFLIFENSEVRIQDTDDINVIDF